MTAQAANLDASLILEGATRSEAVAALRHAFEGAGLPSARLDARVLVGEAAGLAPIDLLLRPDSRLEADAVAQVRAFAGRRLAREPVARILGRAEFWGLRFSLSPETLVPRPDTEAVVEAVLARMPGRSSSRRIVDLGTGSGCILVALLSELPNALGIGLDRSPGALATARANAALNGVGGRASFVASDWAAALAGPVDILVSNPPYIPRSDLAGLAPEVTAHDPGLALDGGPDGLRAIRQVLADARRLLTPAGLAVLEIGFDQREAASALAEAAGLRVEEVRADLGGHPRALVATRI